MTSSDNFFKPLFNRFPVAASYLIVLAIWKFVHAVAGDSSFTMNAWSSIVTYGCIAGTILSLAAGIWGEFFWRKKSRIIVQALVNCIFIGLAATFYYLGTYLNYFTTLFTALFLTALTAVVFVPAVKDKLNEREAWLFSYSQSLNILILGTGYYIITWLVGLLGNGASFSAYNNLLNGVVLVLLMFAFMHKIPTPRLIEKNAGLYTPTVLANAVVKFIMLPVSYLLVVFISLATVVLMFSTSGLEPLECAALIGGVAVVAAVIFASLFYSEALRESVYSSRYVKFSQKVLPFALILLFTAYFYILISYNDIFDGIVLYLWIFGVWGTVSAISVLFDKFRNSNIIPLGFCAAVLIASAVPGLSSDINGNLEDTFSLLLDTGNDNNDTSDEFVPTVEYDLFGDDSSSEPQNISDDDFNSELEQMKNQ